MYSHLEHGIEFGYFHFSNWTIQRALNDHIRVSRHIKYLSIWHVFVSSQEEDLGCIQVSFQYIKKLNTWLFYFLNRKKNINSFSVCFCKVNMGFDASENWVNVLFWRYHGSLVTSVEKNAFYKWQPETRFKRVLLSCCDFVCLLLYQMVFETLCCALISILNIFGIFCICIMMNLIALECEHYFTKGTAVFIPYFRYWQITNGLKVQLEQCILKCVHCCCILA